MFHAMVNMKGRHPIVKYLFEWAPPTMSVLAKFHLQFSGNVGIFCNFEKAFGIWSKVRHSEISDNFIADGDGDDIHTEQSVSTNVIDG